MQGVLTSHESVKNTLSHPKALCQTEQLTANSRSLPGAGTRRDEKS